MFKKLKHNYYLRIAKSGKAKEPQQIKIIRRKQKTEINALIHHQKLTGNAQEELAYYKEKMLVIYADLGNELYNRRILSTFLKTASVESVVSYMRKFSILGSYLTLYNRKDWTDIVEAYLVDKNAEVTPELEMLIVQDARLCHIFHKDRIFYSLAANRQYKEMLESEGKTKEAKECADRILLLESGLARQTD